MVALLGFGEVVQMLVELLLLEERRAVDALQLLALRVALPVGARQLHHLERADLAGGGQVRAAAQVDEAAVAVDADLLVGGKLVDMLELEALVGEDLLGLLAADDLAHERLVGLDDGGHLLLDGAEVVGRERARQLEVVEEAVLGGGTERDLGAGEQLLDGLGHHMRAGMAHDAERLGRFGRDDLHGGAVVNGGVEIDRRAVDLAGERGLRQARADGGGHVGDRGSLGELLDGSVGKDDVHVVSFLAPGAHKAPALIWCRARTKRLH